MAENGRPSKGNAMTESTLIQGPWPDEPEPGRGRGWRAMWSAEADCLHVELLAQWQAADGWRPEVIDIRTTLCDAADVVRQDLPSECHFAITEACCAFAIWLDRFAPGSGLRGLAHLLELRAAARWGE